MKQFTRFKEQFDRGMLVQGTVTAAQFGKQLRELGVSRNLQHVLLSGYKF
jgi:hypothetical protein